MANDAKPTRANFDDSEFVVAKSSLPKAERDQVFYGRDGSEVFSENDAAAKMIHGRCYVRYSVAGADQGGMYDPAEYPDATLSEENRVMGHARYPFKKVEKDSFDQYVKYLETKNKSFLRNAERFA